MTEETRIQKGGREQHSELRPDCDRCCGLCCVAPAFSASADFAIDKVAGRPCPHLLSDFRCDIHHRLRAEGFPGCVAFDCYGAGQKVTQITFAGVDWQEKPECARRMFDVFMVMRQLHEQLMYLDEAQKLEPAASLQHALRRQFEEIELQTHRTPDELLGLDISALKREVHEILLRVGSLVRAAESDD